MSDSLLDFVRPLLKRHEGVELHVYKDTRGIRTIGVGFNLEQRGARGICEQVGADYDALLAGTADLTPEQSDAILNHFIISTIQWLIYIFPEFETYSVARRAALIDMGFMGEGSFSGFHGMIAAIKADLWGTAAQHALQSRWAEQVGRRAHDIAELLING